MILTLTKKWCVDMSSRKIKSSLAAKGYKAKSVEFVRNDPTPSGYGQGYNIELDWSESLEDQVFDLNNSVEFSQYMEFDSLGDVLSWVSELPDITNQTGN